jgi:hypothetical protein
MDIYVNKKEGDFKVRRGLSFHEDDTLHFYCSDIEIIILGETNISFSPIYH